MVIREGTDSIEIVAAERVPDRLPTPGDTRLEIAVHSQGFSGHGSVWVEADRLRAFAARLRELDAHRQGAAELESLSPGELRLRVEVVDRRGHVAVLGSLACERYVGENGPYRHAVEFGFEFDPTALPAVRSGFEAIAEGHAERAVAADRGPPRRWRGVKSVRGRGR
jgi:hypothetical protein